MQVSEPPPQEPQEPQEAEQQQPPQELSEYDRLRAEAAKAPHDAAGWQRLVEHAEQSGDTEKIKEAYEALLEAYPNTASIQIEYLRHFLNPGLFHIAESLFSRFLRPSPSVELWKFYLVYVRRFNTEPAQREVVKKAYEFALSHIGQDKDSGEIWKEYIDFLSAGETHNTWEEQQKMDALRNVYHRAVQIPLENVEALWRELDAFENKLNKITAKKFMADLSPSYMQARTVLREMRLRLSALNQQTSSFSPARFNLPQPLTYTSQERQLLNGWKTYLLWEEGNPLEMEDKDKAQLQTRIQLMYRQAVVKMRFSPEIWYMAHSWTSRTGKQDDAVVLLKQGMHANPMSYLLTFAYAEVQEQLKNYEEVNATYTKFIDALHAELEEMDAEHQKELAAAAAAEPNNNNASFSAPFDPNAPPPGLSVNSPSAATISSQASQHELMIADRRQELGIVWIQYMRFARRAEGLKPARTVFSKARKDKKWVTWEVFEAAALMEYHCTKATDVATRIFQNGLNLFSGEIEFVDHYLAFLISINDESNARALFERAVPTFPGPKGKILWDRWGRYEYQYGDLEAALKFDKRLGDAFKEVPPIKRFADRYKYGTQLDAIASRDLGVGGRHTRVLRSHETNATMLGAQKTVPNLDERGDRERERDRRHDSPERERKRGPNDSFAPQGPPKRARPQSPPPRDREREREMREREQREREREREMMRERERDQREHRERELRDRERERWDRTRRPNSPPYRNGSPAGGMRRDRDREDDRRGPAIPPAVGQFLSTLPNAQSFDGPVFRIDDLMQLFRNAAIPPPGPPQPPMGMGGPPRGRSPPPPRGRPPPDYGPYTGPGAPRRGRF
ncbi:Suf-domain-containing protein [Auricularia subglabra TFB-10046 SS5]|nr:Suf-domain-containing protein [Auricularia subglabra TFB-10046 SS5]